MPLCCSLHVWTEECIPKLISGGTNVPHISPYMCQLFRLQESHQWFQSQDTHWFPGPGKFCPHHDQDISKVHVVMTQCMFLHPKQHRLNHCLILGFHLRDEDLAKFWKHYSKKKTKIWSLDLLFNFENSCVSTAGPQKRNRDRPLVGSIFRTE